jgi:4-amino-4-deoxy-L-arabinose transferase-like glycosyltransferase
MRAAGRAWLVIAALIALTGGALALRLSGIGFLLPAVIEPDGPVLVWQLECLETGTVNPEREFYRTYYPETIAALSMLAPKYEPSAPLAELDFDGHLELALDRNLRVRRTVAVLSCLTVPATWLLARHFLSGGWSLVAAAFVAMSFLHQWWSQESRPHAAATSFFTFAMVLILHFARRPGLTRLLAAGAALGLAVGTLQNGAAIGSALATAVILAWRRPSPSLTRPRIFWGAASALVLSLGIAWICYPTAQALNKEPTAPLSLDLNGGAIMLGNHRILFSEIDFGGARTIWEALWAYEPILTALALLGTCLALLHHGRARLATLSRETLVVLGFVLPYLVAITIFRSTYQRFAIPLVPYLAVLAGWLLQRFVGLLRARPGLARQTAAWLAVCLPLAGQATQAVQLARVRSAEDTTAQCARWIREKVPAGFKILVLPPLSLAIPHRVEQLDSLVPWLYTWPFPWIHHQIRRLPRTALTDQRRDLDWIPLQDPVQCEAIAADPAAYLAACGAELVVVHVLEMVRMHPAYREIRQTLKEHATLVAQFRPDRVDPGHEVPFDYEDFEHNDQQPWCTRVWGAASTGPILEIYRLPQAPGRR